MPDSTPLYADESRESTESTAQSRSNADISTLVRSLAEIADLELSEAQTEILWSMIADYNRQFSPLRQILPLDHEPPVIANDREPQP